MTIVTPNCLVALTVGRMSQMILNFPSVVDEGLSRYDYIILRDVANGFNSMY